MRCWLIQRTCRWVVKSVKLPSCLRTSKALPSTAEALDPEALVYLLNEYLDETCEIVLRYNGTIDKIVGDALHVLFKCAS